MTLRHSLNKDGHRRGKVVLTECPACGIEFKGGLHRRDHIGNHAPEDFGLSPLAD